MDLSIFLLLPLSAVVAYVAVMGAALAGRSRPRLIWPFAGSILLSVPVFFAMPKATQVGMWLFQVVMLTFWWAAIGTIIGAVFARVTIAVVHRMKKQANVCNR